MTIELERAKVVEVAMTWENTPFRDRGQEKGAAADCAQFPQAVYIEAGVVEPFKMPSYSPQFLLHQTRELYLETVVLYAWDIDGPPLPGDLVVWKFGKTFSHGAIVLDWPRVIHAHKGAGFVIQTDASNDGLLLAERNGKPRQRMFYSLKRWHPEGRPDKTAP